jgi:hypothetical protein
VFLLSDKASFVTGIAMPVDGGPLAGERSALNLHTTRPRCVSRICIQIPDRLAQLGSVTTSILPTSPHTPSKRPYPCSDPARRSYSSEHCNFNATAGNILASQFDRAVGPLIPGECFLGQPQVRSALQISSVVSGGSFGIAAEYAAAVRLDYVTDAFRWQGPRRQRRQAKDLTHRTERAPVGGACAEH